MAKVLQSAVQKTFNIKDSMPAKRLCLVVGLGNPGVIYQKTRHNVGFLVADRLAEAFHISFEKTKFNILFGRGLCNSVAVILAKPMAYMNRSGLPTRQLADFYKIPSRDLIIIHDDIDLAFGRLKLKEKGGHGGHNGIRSLIDAFGGGDFMRLRIGVGRSETGISVSDHVLGRFSSYESENLEQIISRARDAVVTVLNEGIRASMNKFNNKKL
jgi:PTH1 family peptidyl-tRNA hydrolase